MKSEWQDYWAAVRRNLKGYSLALGVSLVFYLFSIPNLSGAGQHVESILICVVYGTVIYSWIMVLYSLYWALLTWRYTEQTRPAKLAWPVHVLLGFSGTALGLISAQLIQSMITGDPFSPNEFLNELTVGVFVALMFMFYYAYKNSAEENLQLRVGKAESDLHVLRSQMQPHFLFNSLNSLAALIEQNPATAGSATQKLADLYRLILECSKNQLSPLVKELQIVELYLQIEQIRFGERLRFSLPEVPEQYRNVLVPSLIVQTLVENAVKHGIAKSVEGGNVQVRIDKKQDGLHLEVINSGAMLSAKLGDGTGLKNTRERLDLVFGAKHRFALASDAQGITSAGFLVPGV